MDAPKVTHTSACACGRGPAPHGPGVVNPGVCGDCFEDGARSFWSTMGLEGDASPVVKVVHRDVRVLTDHQRNFGF